MEIVIAGNKIAVPDKPIGVSFSAGLDSTLLLYLLASQVTQDIHLFTVTVTGRKHNTMKHSSDVLTYILEALPNVKMYQHTNLVTADKEGISQLLKLPLQYLQSGAIGSIFAGLNKIPKKEEIDLGWPHPGTIDYIQRDPNKVHSLELFNGWYVPFANLDKKGIRNLYKEHNIEDLVHLTKSCKVDYGEAPCQDCFACREKFWAFGYY